MENAIIMASGMGTRMRPLTLKTPKPLVKVKGKPMIETVIESLLKRDVDEIWVVTGYLAEQFDYLTGIYPKVRIIKNADYETVNNISSVYYARDILLKGPCLICEADLFVADMLVLNVTLNYSCYFGKMVRGYSDDWVFEQDNEGFIMRVGRGGTDCFNMVGVSYFDATDSEKLKGFIEKAYNTAGYEDKYWDDVVNENLDSLRLRILPIKPGQIIEIDTEEELREINNYFERGM